jgi:succinate dehydrogenase / fumarate reductase, cytochrome b subunit
VKATRPVYLNLWRIRFPLPAIISILHRVSGIVIFLGLAILLYLLSLSLGSQDSFNYLKRLTSNSLVKLVLWIVSSAVIFHFLAGVRHIIMDLGAGESLRGGRLLAASVAIVSAIAIILMGVWIW